MMMRRLLLLGLLVFTSPIFAGVFTAELDKTVGTLDEPFVCTLTVSGDYSGEPKLPEINGLRISAAGTSSNFTMINGATSRSTAYRFVIQALMEGNYEIPSIKLTVDGAVQQTAPLRFKVQKEGASPDGGPPVAFVERELSDKKVYLGEPVIAKIRIYFREQLAQIQDASEANTHFRVFKSENQKTYTKEVDGVTYRVHELTEVLVPTKVGKLTLNPTILEAQIPDRARQRRRPGDPGSLFEDFFGGSVGGRYKRKVLRAEAEEIEVLPVPKQGQPKDFSGLVGSFQLEAALADEDIKTGDTVTLTVTVRGRGIVDQLEQLNLDLPNAMKVYTDKPISEQVIDDELGFVSRKVFKFAIVPTEPGTYDLPPVTLRVFVPKLGSYVELSAELPQLNVAGAKESIGTTIEDGKRKQQVKRLAEDLLGIHRGDRLRVQQRLVAFDFWLLSFISGLPTFALFVGWFWRRRKDHVDSEAILQRRRSHAFKLLSSEIKAATGSSVMFQQLRVYLGNVLGLKGSAVTEKDAIARLLERGVVGEVVNELKQLWVKLVKAEYGGAQVEQLELASLREQILRIAKEIDRQC